MASEPAQLRTRRAWGMLLRCQARERKPSQNEGWVGVMASKQATSFGSEGTISIFSKITFFLLENIDAKDYVLCMLPLSSKLFSINTIINRHLWLSSILNCWKTEAQSHRGWWDFPLSKGASGGAPSQSASPLLSLGNQFCEKAPQQ